MRGGGGGGGGGFAIFSKGDNICDFLYASIDTIAK